MLKYSLGKVKSEDTHHGVGGGGGECLLCDHNFISELRKGEKMENAVFHLPLPKYE